MHVLYHKVWHMVYGSSISDIYLFSSHSTCGMCRPATQQSIPRGLKLALGRHICPHSSGKDTRQPITYSLHNCCNRTMRMSRTVVASHLPPAAFRSAYLGAGTPTDPTSAAYATSAQPEHKEVRLRSSRSVPPLLLWRLCCHRWRKHARTACLPMCRVRLCHEVTLPDRPLKSNHKFTVDTS